MEGESQDEREPHLDEREGIRARAWRGKDRLYRKKGRFLGGKGGQARRVLPRRDRRKHERVSGRKSSPGRSAKSWFHSMSGQA